VNNLLPFQLTIRYNIKKQMKVSGLSQKMLSSSVGLTPVAVSRIMSGITPLTERHIIMFSEALQVDPEVFFADVYDSEKIKRLANG